jgi:cell division septation protein DedD
MNINYKEAQFEFFPNAVTSADETSRPHFLTARLTLSVENLVILTIVSIMVILFAFSLGVERGKGFALQAQDKQVSDENIVRDDDKSVADMMVSSKGDKMAAEAKATSSKQDKMKAGLSTPVQKPQDKGLMTKILAVNPDNKKPAKTTAVLASMPKSSGGYTVQVASYKSANGAQKEAASLKQKGYSDIFIVSKGKYVILCIGSFQKKEEADVFGQKKLKSRYQDLRVRSL